MKKNDGAKKKQQNKRVWLYTAILCLLVAACGWGIYLTEKRKQTEAEAKLRKLLESVNEAGQEEPKDTEPTKISPEESAGEEEKVSVPLSLEEKKALLEEKYGIEIPEKALDFQDLQENTNPDIYAWITIPETMVDYPILQHPTDNRYYLDYNIDGSKGFPGCIYSESYTSKDFSDRMTVLYGHNMKNHKMFSDLHKFEDASFFKENKYIYIYTENDIFVYRIFAAHQFSSVHLLLDIDLSEDRIFLDFLQGILDSREMVSNVDADTVFTAEDKIITLSTCVRGVSNKRYLVQGVLLNASE